MADPDAAIERMKRTACLLETDRVRLNSAMHGIMHIAGFSGLVAAVNGELQRIAQEQGHTITKGWIG